MRYKFKVSEDGKERVEKEEMSFKKLMKSLLNINPKWSGIVGYKNKKDRWVNHCFTNGRRTSLANERRTKSMKYTECEICGCMPKPDEWSHIAGICFDCT